MLNGRSDKASIQDANWVRRTFAPGKSPQRVLRRLDRFPLLRFGDGKPGTCVGCGREKQADGTHGPGAFYRCLLCCPWYYWLTPSHRIVANQTAVRLVLPLRPVAFDGTNGRAVQIVALLQIIEPVRGWPDPPGSYFFGTVALTLIPPTVVYRWKESWPGRAPAG